MNAAAWFRFLSRIPERQDGHRQQIATAPDALHRGAVEGVHQIEAMLARYSHARMEAERRALDEIA